MHALHMKEVDATQVGGDCSHPDKRFFSSLPCSSVEYVRACAVKFWKLMFVLPVVKQLRELTVIYGPSCLLLPILRRLIH